MSMLSGNEDALRDAGLLGEQANPGDLYDDYLDVDPSDVPEWDDDSDVVFDRGEEVNSSIERESGSEADVVDSYREEDMEEDDEFEDKS